MKYLIISFALFALFSCNKDEITVPEPEVPIVTVPVNSTKLKSGKFNGANGYPSNGTAHLIKDSVSKFAIVLDTDFSTSFATGSVTMYLSKTSIPNFNDQNTFIKLGVINKNGLHSFVLEGKPGDELNNVVVWCQPAGVKFGHAELK